MDEAPFTSTVYRQHLALHRLMGSRCLDCSAVYLPPRPLCPNCYGEQMEWIEFSGRGKLAAFTAIHIGSSAMIAVGYDRQNPYCSGIVQLEEGPSISAQILGLETSAPARINIGTPLEARFVERSEGEETNTYLAFEART